nr:hypothetical protein CFP56_34871 [Quercus suber]
MKMASTMPKHDRMPRMLVKERKRSGTNPSGMMMIPQTIFHSVSPQPGMRASRESAKRTTNATQAAISSRLKRMEVVMRAQGPKETKARSAKVMRLLSTSAHLARSLAV